MWTPQKPTDFSKFKPSDFPRFLQWWERQNANVTGLGFVSAFVEGVSNPFLRLIKRGAELPRWLQTLLRIQKLAQWSYQAGVPIANRLIRGLEALIPNRPHPEMFRVTPEQIAEIPDSIRRGFLEGARFSMQWVGKLSADGRQLAKDLLAINTLRNRSPAAVVPILERLLHREFVRANPVAGGRTPAGNPPADGISVSPKPEQIDQWLQDAVFKQIQTLARRAKIIAQTESMRMMNMGILSSLEAGGGKLAYVMPHLGSCEHCRRLIDGRVFRITTLKENLFKNIGRKPVNWVASLPQHVFCRHSPMAPPVRFRRALRDRVVPADGLLLEWYGLPGGKEAAEALGLPKVDDRDWLLQSVGGQS